MRRDEDCPAEYEDTGYRCEAGEKGHKGSHYFTSYVDWDGCWSCGYIEGEGAHDDMFCEAREDIDAA
jgi:hypothetical protein